MDAIVILVVCLAFLAHGNAVPYRKPENVERMGPLSFEQNEGVVLHDKEHAFPSNWWVSGLKEYKDPSYTKKKEFTKMEKKVKTKKARGCTAPELVPKKPFVVIWNVPSHGCDLQGIHFDFKQFGITANAGDNFFGSENLIWYNLGNWPRLNRDGSAVNGGIPQQGDLTAHMAKVVRDTVQTIPDVNFDGVGVIDFESWRPIWETDFSSLRTYQARSIDLVKKEHPTWTNNTQIVAEATKQFEAAAKAFMLGTIQKVKELRTSGYFGYYGYPRCWGVPTGKDVVCPQGVTTRINDELGWLFSASNGLFPRIYFDPKYDHIPIHNALRRILNETARVQAKFSGLDTPILPYAIFQTGTHLFDKGDLDMAIREPADLGAAGVVFWGSSAMFHLKNECQKLQQYTKDVFGPYVNSTETFFQQCSQTNCNGHGRCIRKDYQQMTQFHLNQNNENTDACYSDMDSSAATNNEFSDSYGCRCFQGWIGPNCLSSLEVDQN